MALSYAEAIAAISQFYNTDAANVWNVINDYNLTAEQAFDLVPNPANFFNTGYGTINYANGQTASWNNFTQLSVQSGGNPLDSNIGSVIQTQYQLPTSTDYSGGGANYFNGGQPLGNVPQGTTPIMTQVATGVAAAGVGIALGKIINQAAYDNGYNWLEWAGVNIESLSPETWDSITVDMSDTGFEGAVKRAFNAIFGIDNSGNSQMYIDTNAAAYLSMYMDKTGLFSSGEISATYDNAQHPDAQVSTNIPQPLILLPGETHILLKHPRYFSYKECYYSGADYLIIFLSGNNIKSIAISKTNNDITAYERNSSTGQYTAYTGQSSTHTTKATGTTFYSNIYFGYSGVELLTPLATNNANILLGTSEQIDIGTIVYDGNVNTPSAVSGIDTQNGAVVPDFSNCITPADYLTALQNQYPDLFNNAITQNVAQPDGTVIPHTYIPVGTPTATSTSDMQPTTDDNTTGQSQSNPLVNPSIAPNPLIEGLVNLLTNIMSPDVTPPQNPTDTGDGDTPPVAPPTGNASSLWAVYNPTQGQVDTFGAWLWSSNFVDQIKKLFADPMQGIIGLHKIFATPATGGAQNIKVGYLDSGVASAVVTSQYTDIDCGTVNVAEYFGNVFDYEDTQIRLYLPFIGIVDLSTSDVMRGSVQVIYHVDVITGACLADVNVFRDGGGGVLYQYSGDAAVRYPVSSGSYMGMVSGVLAVVGGIASVATGGALAPALMGAAGGVMRSKTDVKHSGNFSGAAGAMGSKIPYLIIERPQTAVAAGYIDYQGIGDNKIVAVGSLSGYFKMTDVHTNNLIGATGAEIEQIKTVLERGVIQ